MPRKGRARRFREARQLKQGYEDGLFSEGDRTLADVDVDEADVDGEDWDEDEDKDDGWADEDPLLADEGGRQAS